VGFISPRTPRIWRLEGLNTPERWWIWPCGWWSRTDCPIGRPRGICGGTIESSFPSPPFRTGSRRRGKKGAERVRLEYLDGALATFSGYIAADELYDGPFCVLSIVDNRTFRRLIYEVLDHDPTQKDIESFLRRFKGDLDQRGLSLQGVTTDGSPLYPHPLATIFPGVAHQICEFHVLAELTKAVLRAVAKMRKRLKARMPTLQRGRPSSPKAKRDARKKTRLQQRVTDLFDHRHLFVQKCLSPVERRTLLRISRGLPELRTLREIMHEVYRLFDRRCRTATAVAKLVKLRTRVRRFESVGRTLQKLFSPTLEKALTFLDDSLLPSTSNAVERGNRRHRKMQKSVYSVRTLRSLQHRMALDLLREQSQAPRLSTLHSLHRARAA
jgi:hypothetical protein